MTTEHDLSIAAAKAAPPLAVTSGTVMGYPLPDLVLWATLLYTVIQVVILMPKLAAAIKKIAAWVRERI